MYQEKLHSLQRKIRSSNESLRNHLLSIVQDSSIVEEIRTAFPSFACFGNLRNGLWYARSFDGTCYFKSTDGHLNNLKFSPTRLNLDIAVTAIERHAVIIVDSTRRGKMFPDSMTSTIPIWIAVLNAIALDDIDHCGDYFISPPWMSNYHVSQITKLLPHIIASLPEFIIGLMRDTLCGKLTRPMRPLWCCPTSGASDDIGAIEWMGEYAEAVFDVNNWSAPSLDFIPVILLSCSRVCDDAKEYRTYHSWHYLQGAGDDEENWADGLTPSMFWNHKDFILQSDDPQEVHRTVAKLVGDHCNRLSSPELKHTSSLPYDISRLGSTQIHIVGAQSRLLLTNVMIRNLSHHLLNERISMVLVICVRGLLEEGDKSRLGTVESLVMPADGSFTHAIDIMDVFASCAKKDKAKMDMKWQTIVLPACANRISCIDATGTTAVMLMCEKNTDVEVLSMLATAVVILSPGCIPALAAWSASTFPNNKCDHKEIVRCAVAWVHNQASWLRNSRMLTKELISYLRQR